MNADADVVATSFDAADAGSGGGPQAARKEWVLPMLTMGGDLVLVCLHFPR